MSGGNGKVEAEPRKIHIAGEITAEPFGRKGPGSTLGRQDMNPMTCREFDEVVHEFVRMEMLDVALREATLEHAAHCASCAERMAEAGLLAETTHAIAEKVREQEAPPRVQAALLAAFRDRHRRTVWWRAFEWATAGAAAAVLAVVLWTSGGPTKVQPSPVPRKDVSAQSKAPLDAAGPQLSQPDSVAEQTEIHVASASSTGTYKLTDFVPVPFTDAVGPDDPVMVVSVQLRRSSLAELGYPVAAMPDEDLISAYVLVGEDGWPRGVKLVR
jgi:hypothetical protein